MRILGIDPGTATKIMTGSPIPEGADTVVRVEDADDPLLPASALVSDVVSPALAEAERTFSAALARINVADMAKRAEALK